MAFSGEEQIGFYYPYSQFVQEALRDGTSLLWNTSHYGGVPTNIDQFASTWNLLHRALLWLLPFYTAHHVSILIGVIAGLIGAYVFGRAEGLSKGAAVFCALAFFSATTFGWLQIGTLSSYTFAVTPWILYALRLTGEWRTWYQGTVAGGLAFGIGIIAGTTQVLIYSCVVFGLYALRLDFEYWREQRVVNRVRSTLALLLMLCGGVAIGFVQWYPSAALLDLTVRTDTFALQNATPFFPTQLSALVLPPFFQIPHMGGGSTEGLYTGALGLIGIALAFLYVRSKTVISFTTAWIIIAGFGFHVFPFSWINEHISPLSHMSGNLRWLIAGAFPLAFVAATGVNLLFVRPHEISQRVRLRLFAFALSVAAALLVLGVGLPVLLQRILGSPEIIQGLFSRVIEGRTLGLPQDHYLAVFVQFLEGIKGQWTIMYAPYLIGTISWIAAALCFYLIAKGATGLLFKRIILASACIPLMAMGPLQWHTYVPQSVYAAEPALVTTIRNQPNTEAADFRTLGFLVGEGLYRKVFAHEDASYIERAMLQRETLTHDISMLWNIDRMDGFEPYRSIRANRLLNSVVEHESTQFVFSAESLEATSGTFDSFENRDTQKQVSFEEKLQDFFTRLPLLSMMNVRFIYSPYELNHPQLTQVAEIELPKPAENVQIFLYENVGALPRVYISHGQKFVSSGERDALYATIDTLDFRAHTVIECASCESAPGNGEVSVLKYENGNVSLETDTTGDVWMVFSEAAMPGWRAYIDSKEVPLYVANYLFQAVQVPPGKHIVDFRYSDVRPW